ncbi:aquaporin-4 isoform X2 [Erpetoichthys calabaricus]|uniref:aquaporin-4 isoform X2 n=1 Tax=Erpetoichthys calabaricus TaxID=27687 RepID=UPI0022349E4D|nr:aquaporin-4 isoform X2 [Erpetoichthys calabaricus]
MPLKEELKSRRFWRAVLAEILGSLIFVSAVLGSSIPNQAQDCSILLLQPALAAGFTAVGLGHCFGDISGAQVNPAVTLAFLATRKLDILRTASYIIGQCLGATMAAGILYLTIPLKSAARCYVNMINPESNAGQALGMEVLATFQLVFTIFSVEDHRRREGHISGGSMNPARSLGPAIITGYWEHHWVYWIGPMLGALMAGFSHEFFFAATASRQKLINCITCKDIEIIETGSVSRSSLSTVTQSAMRAKQSNKHDHS